ncbi:MAG: hypothetical protein J2P30_01360 [Actinobacteria bacterium]|nr:hypothetical protein [Actinomycetota bacterium]
MYDMYDWDRSAPEDTAEANRAHASHQAAANGAGRARARAGHPRAARAVQVALDRRDNGGDFRDSRD